LKDDGKKALSSETKATNNHGGNPLAVLQRRSQGYAVPDSFTHGTSEQRQRWFANRYKKETAVQEP
jgi:predicted metalloprotease